MSFRIEEKLFIKKENLIQFKEHLFKKKVSKLYNSRIIKSLYFDNMKLDMYNDSIEGLLPRKKIRIRKYPNDKEGKIFLEIKNSSVEGRYKKRKIINQSEYENKILTGILDNQYGACFPKLFVEYSREYLIMNDVRISIDQNIQYKDYLTNNIFNDNKIIVELKTSINKNLDELTSDFPMQRVRFSKYCYAIESLNNFTKQSI